MLPKLNGLAKGILALILAFGVLGLMNPNSSAQAVASLVITPSPPPETPIPTETPLPTATPTNTPTSPTETPIPPTATPIPPTATPIPPTAPPPEEERRERDTPTATPEPPTLTVIPPTETPTLVPPTEAPTLTPTPVVPRALPRTSDGEGTSPTLFIWLTILAVALAFGGKYLRRLVR